MAQIHHTMAYQVSNILLDKWRNKESGWDNIVSEDVRLLRTKAVFPIPDATFYDYENESGIAMEFKPPTETKRGILTGLGQSIAYLNNYSIVYLVFPEIVEGQNISEYILETFNKLELNKKIPLGLISYNPNDINDVKLLAEIDISKENIPKTKELKPGTYWATFRDTYPDAIWRILDIAYNMEIDEYNRKSKVWDKFYKGYLLPIPDEFFEKEEIDSDLWLESIKTYRWDKDEKQFIGEDDLKKAKEAVESGEKDIELALNEIKNKFINPSGKDNKSDQLKKNNLNLINHLGLWDDQANLTTIGLDLHRVGKLYGSTSNMFIDYLAKIILIEGKHLDLILEVDGIIKDNIETKSTKNEAIENLYEIMDSQGKIKKNPNRSQSSTRDFLESEQQLWGKLGILNKKGISYFVKGKGYNFNWDRITSLLLK
ncbi:hypothetical protein [Paraclostridium sordellii]|uniref:hypothetical protein n=1 Tax=Paraclostridium sordellii TaxID=1505 RepID=UPI0005E666F7|nr:hypothetical protein [Paeniclostridium sordellii]CEP43682.1 Uncharacterised protein [[Clostridium] sordellii] [Paeniclostridium sordellii]